jgi:hypothetical protein
VARRGAPSCKRKDVLELEAQAVSDAWDGVIDGLARGLTLLRERCGVVVPYWLPSHQLLIPLAAILTKLGSVYGPAMGAALNRIVQWYWCSLFGQTYDLAPNTRAANDLGAVLAWIEGGEAPEAVRSFQFDTMALDEITPNQRALYKGLIGLVLRRVPRDFHTGQPLTGEIILDRHVDDHHVFPDNFLKKQCVEPRLRNSILNRTLIDRTTNQVISDRAPSAYMAEIRAALGPAAFAEVIDSHLLPSGGASPLWTDDFERFVTWRREALYQEVMAATGVQWPGPVEGAGRSDDASLVT